MDSVPARPRDLPVLESMAVSSPLVTSSVSSSLPPSLPPAQPSLPSHPKPVDPFFEAPLPPKLSVSAPNSPKPSLAKLDNGAVEEDEWNGINRLLSELLDLEDEAKAAEVSEYVHSLFSFITFTFFFFNF